MALWLTILGAIILAVYAEPLLVLLFGAEFSASSGTLQILLTGVVALSASQILASDLASRGLVGLNLAIVAGVLLLNIAANFTLIPKYGIEGAAIATSGAFASGLAIRLFLTASLFGTKWWLPLIPPRPDINVFIRTIRGQRHRDNG